MMLDNRKPVFGYAKAHEMSVGAAEELEQLEELILYTSSRMEALMDRVSEGDQEAWEKMQELQRELDAKQHRRNSI